MPVKTPGKHKVIYQGDPDRPVECHLCLKKTSAGQLQGHLSNPRTHKMNPDSYVAKFPEAAHDFATRKSEAQKAADKALVARFNKKRTEVYSTSCSVDVTEDM